MNGNFLNLKIIYIMKKFILLVIFLGFSLSLNITECEVKTKYSNNDSLLTELSKEILTYIKNKDYNSFSDFIHPVEGIRFSPYAYVDTASEIKMSINDFKRNIKSKKKQSWGSFDGSGDPILMTLKQYFKRFVYDVDFLNPEIFTVNKRSSGGNTIDNREDIYPGSVYTESYFSGFEEKYGGMDWRALRLVFKELEGHFYLVAVIHDEWTI